MRVIIISLFATLACAGIIKAATTIGTNISTGGTLDVTGASTLTGNTNIAGSLTSLGANTLYGATSIGGALTATSTLTVTGNSIFSTASSTGIVKFSQINSDTGSINFGDENLYTTGNIGIGTSSPYAKLSVVGEVVGSYFTAASTNATSTFTNVGIGTTTPNNLIQVANLINFDNSISGTMLGYQAGNNITSGIQNTFIGYQAGANSTSTRNNTFVGYQSGFGTNLTAAGNNTAVGTVALYSNTTGKENVAIGKNALYSNLSGNSNVAVGVQTLNNNTSGFENTGIGLYALQYNTEGWQNTAMGVSALFQNTVGYNNTAIGYTSLYSITGITNNNTAVGHGSLYSDTSGQYNTALGFQAGYSNLTGSSNVFIGYKAGYNETGSNKLYIANIDTDQPLIYGDFGIGKIGLGTVSPSAKLHILETLTSGVRGIVNEQINNGGAAAQFNFEKSRGTSAAQLIVNSGDNIGTITYYGLDGSNYTPAASFAASVDGTPGSSDMPGRLVFSTTPDGSNGVVERMRIDNAGNVGIGTSTLSSKFTIDNGSTATTTVEFGDRYSSNSKTCFNAKNTAGGNISFYFVGTTMVVENNRCN